jgi:hypothetical protein
LRTLIICIIAAIFVNSILMSAPAEEEAVTSAQKWLSVVDDQKYEESWNQASSMFRSKVTQEQWIAALKRSREPLGALVSRNPSRMEFSRSLPGMPPGEYAILRFTTTFAGKKTSEQVTLVKEDGKWQMAVYSICCGWK